jgi:hypothetical protein
VRPANPLLKTFGASQYWPNTGSGTSTYADVDNDGKKDRVVYNSKEVLVSKSSGTGFQAPQRWLGVTTGSILGTKGTFFADVTADGKADAIFVHDYMITVRPSMGNGFAGPETWHTVPHYGRRGTFFADVNGDGRADAIAVRNDGVIVRLAVWKVVIVNGQVTGSKWQFGDPKNWTGGAYYSDPNHAFSSVYFADINNDKKADALAVNGYGVTVRRSTGSSFSGNEPWTTNPYYGHGCSWAENNFFIDVTGDKQADAIVVNYAIVQFDHPELPTCTHG